MSIWNVTMSRGLGDGRQHERLEMWNVRHPRPGDDMSDHQACDDARYRHVTTAG